MAKTWRTIKFSYNVTTTEIDVRTQTENKDTVEIFEIRETLDGSRYKTITGSNDKWVYSFERCNQDIYDFFFDAYNESKVGNTVTFYREDDDGTFSDYDCIVNLPQYQDDNIAVTDKVYLDFSCEVLEA